MSHRRTEFIVIACVACASTLGCRSHAPRYPAEQQIRTVLDRQSDAWNRGDVEGFMDGYWPSADLTFASGGTLTRGYQPTLERYRTRYPTKEAMGRLTFSEQEIRMLGPDHALVLGRWRLDRDEPVGGLYSLVMRRIDGQWVVIHDHTSRDEK